MNIIKRTYDRLTGVLGYDYQGKPLRKGDVVFPRFPEWVRPGFEFGMEVVSKTPSHAKEAGEIQVLGNSGKLAQAWSVQIKKQPPLNKQADWQEMERATGWKPQIREVEHG